MMAVAVRMRAEVGKVMAAEVKVVGMLVAATAPAANSWVVLEGAWATVVAAPAAVAAKEVEEAREAGCTAAAAAGQEGGTEVVGEGTKEAERGRGATGVEAMALRLSAWHTPLGRG